MAKFVTGEKLSIAIHDLLYHAKSYLIIVSPFIKLDSYLKQILDRHKGNRDIVIFIVFGKNSQSIGKSLSKDDLEYFKSFVRQLDILAVTS
jgi:membrane-bound acyltransferase YfiQ involved in biofilm formation